MSLTLQSPITTARTILNDPTAVRYSEADLLRYANDALDALAKVAPTVFYERTTHTCVAGVVQQLQVTTSLGLVDVHRVVGGNVVTAIDAKMLDLYNPYWRSMTADVAKHWAKDTNDARSFIVYPPSAANQQLEVTHVMLPGEYTAVEATPVPMAYSDAISDYIVYRAESRDEEHVVSQRAAQFLASFIQKAGG
jgi:hypothetical protein